MSAAAASVADRPHAGVNKAWTAELERFSEHLRTHEARGGRPLRQTTRWQYLQQVRWLADSMSCGPWEVTTPQLATWLEGQNWSTETRRKVVVALRTFYAWGVATGRLEWAPTAGIARQAARAPGPQATPMAAAWQEPADEWVATLRARSLSEGTIMQYLVRLRSLSRLAADPWSVTAQQLAVWLSNNDWKPQTKRNARTAVTGFYRWGVKVGRIDQSPAADLDTVRVPRSLPRPVPVDALRAALAAADDRTRLAMSLAAYAGLRIGEIASLHATQVSETHLLIVGKGGHHRVVPLDPNGELSHELRTELSRRRRGGHGTGWSDQLVSADGYLFPSSLHPGPMTSNALGRLISAALPQGWTTHTLRHRFATDAYATERDLLAVQQLLGHSRPETTSIYAQVPDGALLAAVVGAGSRRW